MINVPHSIVFTFRNNILKLEVKWSDYKLYISTGYYIEREKWDYSAHRCKFNTTHGRMKIAASEINAKIEYLIEMIEESFAMYAKVNIIPTKLQLKSTISGIPQTNLKYAWLEYYQYGNTCQWSDNTIRTIRQVQVILDRYYPNLQFSNISPSLLNDFIDRQFRNKIYKDGMKNTQEGYANNVVWKHCSILRRFLKFCADKKYLPKEIVDNWKPKIKYISRPVIYLTWSELMTINSLSLDKRLATVRDIFCFMCFTGLRYSDAITLTKANIGENTIQLTTKKTSRILRIALNKYAKDILDKYLKKRSNRVFPTISNAVMNVHLKTIAKIAGLDKIITLSQYYGSKRVDEEYFKHELISTHCGRRTFVVNALALGISPHVVMKWTGHSDLSAMKPYIDIADDTLMQEMSKFNR